MKLKMIKGISMAMSSAVMMLAPAYAHAAAANALLDKFQKIWTGVYDIGRPFVWTIAICWALYTYLVQADKATFYKPVAGAIILELITAMLAWTANGGGFSTFA